jgi:hypothetical protein
MASLRSLVAAATAAVSAIVGLNWWALFIRAKKKLFFFKVVSLSLTMWVYF